MRTIRKEWQPSRSPDRLAKDFHGMIGTSPAMLRAFQLIREVADSNTTILITGPSGTEKEMAARAIHQRSSRASGPFVVISCAAIRLEFLESEFFGYENGGLSFLPPMPGKVELADLGTLFTEEVTELPLHFQGKLLRFLQDYTFKRVGGSETRKVDLRFICSSNRDIKKLVEQGSFQQDLYLRLNGLTIELPALKDRGVDAWLMAKAFLKSYAAKMGKGILGFTQQAKKTILAHSWPGNIPELESSICRALMMAEGLWITPQDLGLPTPEPLSLARPGFRETITKYQVELVARALADSGRNIGLSAKKLKISRSVIYRLMKKYNL